jgi:hypothetical protein
MEFLKEDILIGIISKEIWEDDKIKHHPNKIILNENEPWNTPTVIGTSSVDYNFVFEKLQKNSTLIILNVNTPQSIIPSLKFSGFINVHAEGNIIIGEKPSYEKGSSIQLPKVSNQNLWEQTSNDEFIEEESLIDSTFYKKPELREDCSPKVSNKKACKNCTCGRAQLEEKELQTTTSSCGNCYLGDAFRCGTCPYLGLPSFKPGEKISLVGSMMESDI